MDHDWKIALSLGLMLAAALVAGQLAKLVKAPYVTAYLLAGLLIGPFVLNLIHDDALHHLEPIAQGAMALVLFNMGCRFSLARVKRILPHSLRLSAGELLLTFLLVSLGFAIMGPLVGSDFGWQEGLLFGALALATAPATTILVLKENESEGPITELATTMTAFNNLAAILIFEVVLLFVLMLRRESANETSAYFVLGQLGVKLLAAAGMGIASGLLASFACSFLAKGKWIVLFVALVALQLGLCDYLELKSLYLLTFLVMGAVVANSYEDAGEIVRVLDNFTGLLCVVFFVIHGAALDLGKLYQAGIIGVGYIALRTLGKYFGVYLSTGPDFRGTAVQHWLGASLLSQAGAAIALCAVAKEVEPELGENLETIILGTVVFFEIVGPVLVRHAVLRGGEVPLSHAIDHSVSTPLSVLAGILNRALESLGFDPWRKKDLGEITVEQLMFRNVKPVAASATFQQVVRSIEHSHDNTFPVTSAQEELIGVIHYVDLRNEVFDAELSTLVCAEDLARPVVHSLHPDETLDTAWQIFRQCADDIIVVVTRDPPARLVGVVRRRDVLKFLRSTNRTNVSDSGPKTGHANS